MKLYLLSIALLCLVATGAHAYWQSRAQVAISAGGGLPIYTYLGSSNQNSIASSTVTFTAFNIGTAASNRVIAVLIFEQFSPPTITGVTVGGNAATQATGAGGATSNTLGDLWYVPLAAGTSANIVITASATINAMTIGVAAIGTSTPTPGTGANFQQGFGTTANTNVTIPGGGVAFAGTVDNAGLTATFSNMTVDDARVNTGPNGNTVYIGHQTVTGTNTATFSGNDIASMSTVPWGP